MKGVNIYSPTGTKVGQATLPQAILAVKINEPLLAQAVRVYLSNQRRAKATAKTRGEVTSITSAKIWRQKGTGRARHGSKRAPIFVGGGKAHGPTGEQNYHLRLSHKMKQAALKSALSDKLKANTLWVIDDLGGIKGKTRAGKKILLAVLKDKAQQKIGLVLPEKAVTPARAFRNLAQVSLLAAKSLTTYEVLRVDQLVFTKESLDQLNTRLGGEKRAEKAKKE